MNEQTKAREVIQFHSLGEFETLLTAMDWPVVTSTAEIDGESVPIMQTLACPFCAALVPLVTEELDSKAVHTRAHVVEMRVAQGDWRG